MISNFAFFTALQNAADLKVSVGAAFCNAVKMQKSSRTIILLWQKECGFLVNLFCITIRDVVRLEVNWCGSVVALQQTKKSNTPN